MRNWFAFSLFMLVLTSSCGKTYTEEQQRYIADIERERKEKDEWMKNDPASPFQRDSSIHFSPLQYFPVDPEYVFKSRLNQFVQKDTITILGTKGEERRVVRYGYVNWKRKSDSIAIHVYKGTSKRGEEYFSMWFTDRTTGKESYGVGRYLDFELHADSLFEYTIDLNLLYSPYCSYSSMYSCAIPSKDDYIDIAILAGEKKFH